jgi:uncharacterized protein YqgV (UPF0045/DUF77 family)
VYFKKEKKLTASYHRKRTEINIDHQSPGIQTMKDKIKKKN